MVTLLWDLKEHHLNYILTVSADVGFWAATPNVAINHNFVFSLDPKPYHDFKGKYGKLGFDPKGHMLYIGKCRNDDVWLAMAPWAFVDGSDDNVPAGHVTGDTRLSTPHYRMLVMFFAYHLAFISDRAFTCDNKYGPSLTDANPSFSLYTNIMYVPLFPFTYLPQTLMTSSQGPGCQQTGPLGSLALLPNGEKMGSWQNMYPSLSHLVLGKISRFVVGTLEIRKRQSGKKRDVIIRSAMLA